MSSAETHATALADVDALWPDIDEYVQHRLIRNTLSTTKKVDERSDRDVQATEKRILARLNRIQAALRAAEPQPGFDAAVDWLLNHGAVDPDMQNAFWALSDGLITDEEANTLGAGEIRERRRQAGALV